MRPGTTSTGIRDEVFNHEFPASIGCDTPNCALTAAGGRTKQKTVQLTTSGAATENLFLLTGCVRTMQIYGCCTAVGDSTTFSDVKFQIYDGVAAVAVDMCAVVDASGLGVGDILVKTQDDGTALTYLDVSVGEVYVEGSTDKKALAEGIASANGGATYLRVSYTGDATTDVTIAFAIRYQPMTPTASFTAV